MIKTRHELLLDIYNRGSATSAEILTADFGGAVPASLQLNTSTQKVKLRSLFNLYALTKHKVDHLYDAIEPEVKASPLYLPLALGMKPFAYAVHGYKALRDIFRLGKDHIAFARMRESGRTIYFNRRSRIEKKFTLSDVLSHEHIHILQKDALRQGRASMLNTKLVDGIYKDGALPSGMFAAGFENYVGSAHEIQARLHVLLVHACAKGGKLPQSKEELWEVLHKTGLIAPKELYPGLAQKHGEAVPLVHYVMQGKKVSQDAYDLEIVNGLMVKDEDQGRFWKEILPQIYANLLELYGDDEAARKFLAQPSSAKPGAQPSL